MKNYESFKCRTLKYVMPRHAKRDIAKPITPHQGNAPQTQLDRLTKAITTLAAYVRRHASEYFIAPPIPF